MSYKQVASDIEGMFSVLTKIADRVGNDEIRISKTRAKEILLEIRSLNKKDKASRPIIKEPAWLDNF